MPPTPPPSDPMALSGTRPPVSQAESGNDNTDQPRPSLLPSALIVENRHAFDQNANLVPDDSSYFDSLPKFHIRNPSIPNPPSQHTSVSTDLHLQTDLSTAETQLISGSGESVADVDMTSESGASAGISISRTGVKSSLSAASMATQPSLSPGSAISSPALAAMTDITPLPSPLMPGESPGPWKRALVRRPGSSSSLSSVREEVKPDDLPDHLSPTRTSPTKRKKNYGSLMPAAVEASSFKAQMEKNDPGHARNRSLSEFVPEQMHNVRPRHATLSGAEVHEASVTTTDSQLHREEYLAEQRGIAHPHPVPITSAPLPTPPPSNRSVTESEGEEKAEDEPPVEYLTLRVGKRKRQYRPVRPLGQGTFSKVVLATSQTLPAKVVLNEASEATLDPKYLVAIKIVEHGPAGGADEERVELSLKREIELLRSISHPSIVHLKAFDFTDTEALLVLNYCPGGDLFDLASQRRDVLTPPIVQRIFAELVDAVSYLHENLIVHRDIKLENVLLNIPSHLLPDLSDGAASYPHPLVTLGDLGLSRRIPAPPASPLLTTRCGSEDYAAPEILLSQAYDGRATDAWALGVLLYALMEGRLAFDAVPQRGGAMRGRARAAHRIARCDWMWVAFGDDDGEWDARRGAPWEGARECVEGLLKKVSRGRLSVPLLKEMPFVRDGILVEGGLRRLHGDEGEDDVAEGPLTQRPSLSRAHTFADLQKTDEEDEGEQQADAVMGS